MSISRYRSRAVLLGALLPITGLSCFDSSPTASRGLVGKLALAPALTASGGEVYRGLVVFGLTLDNLRLKLQRQDGEVVKDTVITLDVDREEVRVEIVVQLRGVEERMQARVELRAADVALFSGTQDVVVRAGSPSSDQTPMLVEYIGPGANATSLRIAPSVISLFTNDSVDFVATALDASQQTVAVTAIAWSVKDAALGAVSASGRFKPALLRGETFVVGKLPTGLKDSARVSVIPLPSQIALISGGGQSGLVGALLGQPIVVELRAADNQPVPGYQVDFAIVSGGGSLSVSRAVTDANGRASTSLTLGVLPGLNVISVSAPGVSPISVNATGLISLP